MVKNVTDELTRRILIELMVSSGHLEYGQVDMDDLTPERIAAELDHEAIRQIRKALEHASNRAPIIMKKVQDTAKLLVRELNKTNQMSLAEMA